MSTAMAAQAVSTCETRVDKHQNATTKQRVNYCLTPQLEATVDPEVPDLVYYGVVNKTPAPAKKESASSLDQSYFHGKDLSVYRNYVGTGQFPELENDILSEKELQELREKEELARLEAIQRARGAQGSFAAQKPQRQNPAKPAKPASSEVTVKNDAKGIAARLSKPGRMMRETSSEEMPEEAAAETEQTEELASNVAGEPGEEETPAAQVAPLEEQDELLED